MLGLDTNVIIRYLIRDDQPQYERARRLVDREVRKGEPLLVSLLVLLESEWVLRSRYELPKSEIVAAFSALLDTADVTNLKLDANLVVLSACNTGGGAAGGEALSGLARSFFYAGARALMVTQWSVNAQVSAYLVADTLNRVHAGTDGGAAGSLRAAQLALIQGAGHGFPANIANPFFWAAFSVIGDGGGTANTQISALSGTPNPRL